MIQLSGHISQLPKGAVATLTLQGDTIQTTTTDSSGNYFFDVEPGTYTIRPTLTGEEFIPENIQGNFIQDTSGPDFQDPPQVNKDLGIQIIRRNR